MLNSSGLVPTISSRLSLTPQLRGQIALLSLAALDYEDQITQIIVKKQDILYVCSPASVIERLFPVRAAVRLPKAPSRGGSADFVAAPSQGLVAYVAAQIRLMFRKQREQELAYLLLEQLAPTGWIEVDPETHAEGIAPGEEAQLLAVFSKLQDIEPAGLFCRNLRECMMLQARAAEQYDAVMEGVIDLLGHVATGRISEVASQLGCSVGEVTARLRVIKTFDPKPGLQFGDVLAPPPEPDLMIRSIGGSWRIEANPRLGFQISDLSGGGEAAMLRGVTEYRLSTLLRVGNWLVENQGEFLRQGTGALHPVTRRSLAAELSVHETTVGRALRHRLVQTPAGMFGFERLFGAVRTRAKSVAGVNEITPSLATAHQVRARISDWIRQEPAQQRLSDGDIARMFAEAGLELSRRTVAKYRSGLGIPPAGRRGA